MKQFAYKDGHGHVYPAHAALAFQPGLVPGHFDTETREFTPIGNPQEQVGSIITDAGTGMGQETVLSGMREDKGAGTAPISGVAFTLPPEHAARLADAETKVVEQEQELADRDQQIAALQAQLALAKGAQAPAPGAGTTATDAGEIGTSTSAVGTDGEAEQAAPADTAAAEDQASPRRVARRVTNQ